MAEGGMASTTRLKWFCGRTMAPLLREGLLRRPDSYEEKRQGCTMHQQKPPEYESQPDPVSQNCNCTKKCNENPIKIYKKKYLINVRFHLGTLVLYIQYSHFCHFWKLITFFHSFSKILTKRTFVSLLFLKIKT